MTFDRRALLTATVAVPAAWALVAVARRAPAEESAVALPAFRRAGDRDDTEAFRRAAATGRTVYLPAGQGSGPDGRYLLASSPGENLASGISVVGDGVDRTIIARSYARQAPLVFFFDSGSADPLRNGRNLSFRDFTIEDDVIGRGFAEFDYLVMLNGVSDVRFERVGFRGFRGDGLHLGSGLILGQERHNQNVRVIDCEFDGINANNRNAISVIDCDGLLVEGCRFLNCSRYGDGSLRPIDPLNPRTGVMAPGPIDLEPNNDGFPVVRNIAIRRNLFRGGGGFAVCMNLRRNDRLRTPQRNIVVTGNTVEDRDGAISASGFPGDDAIRLGPDYGIVFADNIVRRCRTPFILNGMRGLRMQRNAFSDCAGHAEIGNSAGNADVTLRENIFLRCGAAEPGYTLWVRTSDQLTFERNRFEDCGVANGRRFGVAVALVQGRITRLTMTDNLFSSPARRTTVAMQLFNEAQLDRATAVVGPQRMDFAGPTVRETLGL